MAVLHAKGILEGRRPLRRPLHHRLALRLPRRGGDHARRPPRHRALDHGPRLGDPHRAADGRPAPTRGRPATASPIPGRSGKAQSLAPSLACALPDLHQSIADVAADQCRPYLERRGWPGSCRTEAAMLANVKSILIGITYDTDGGRQALLGACPTACRWRASPMRTSPCNRRSVRLTVPHSLVSNIGAGYGERGEPAARRAGQGRQRERARGAADLAGLALHLGSICSSPMATCVESFIAAGAGGRPDRARRRAQRRCRPSAA